MEIYIQERLRDQEATYAIEKHKDKGTMHLSAGCSVRHLDFFSSLITGRGAEAASPSARHSTATHAAFRRWATTTASSHWPRLRKTPALCRESPAMVFLRCSYHPQSLSMHANQSESRPQHPTFFQPCQWSTAHRTRMTTFEAFVLTYHSKCGRVTIFLLLILQCIPGAPVRSSKKRPPIPRRSPRAGNMK